MSLVQAKSPNRGVPTRPARRREPCPVTRVAKKLLRLSADATQWERAYDVLAWAHDQATNGKTHAGNGGQDYQSAAFRAARNLCDGEVNVRQQELGAYLNLTISEIADRI